MHFGGTPGVAIREISGGLEPGGPGISFQRLSPFEIPVAVSHDNTGPPSRACCNFGRPVDKTLGPGNGGNREDQELRFGADGGRDR